MANCGLPATSGFVGEFMVIMGALKSNFWIGFLAATTLITRKTSAKVRGPGERQLMAYPHLLLREAIVYKC